MKLGGGNTYIVKCDPNITKEIIANQNRLAKSEYARVKLDGYKTRLERRVEKKKKKKKKWRNDVFPERVGPVGKHEETAVAKQVDTRRSTKENDTTKPQMGMASENEPENKNEVRFESVQPQHNTWPSVEGRKENEPENKNEAKVENVQPKRNMWPMSLGQIERMVAECLAKVEEELTIKRRNGKEAMEEYEREASSPSAAAFSLN